MISVMSASERVAFDQWRETSPLGGKTFHQLIELMRREATDLGYQLNEARRELLRAAQEAWEAAGGCPRCRGRGWIVTWDTMDSMSGCYHDSGRCPDCDGQDYVRGLRPGNNKYDRLHPETPMGPEVPDDAATTELAHRLASLRAQIEDYEDLVWPERGKRMVVVRGRKVPQGTVGVVFWVGRDRYSDDGRAGLETTDGKRVFVRADYLEPAP